MPHQNRGMLLGVYNKKLPGVLDEFMPKLSLFDGNFFGYVLSARDI
jgi:hypothetical protein